MTLFEVRQPLVTANSVGTPEGMLRQMIELTAAREWTPRGTSGRARASTGID
jgi:hypothetical protein